MSDSPRRLRGVSLTTVVVLVLTTAVSTAVLAAHSFTDVPDTNTFHEDISWLANNRVTIGCNPPANTEFCPEDNVTREQMSAFMHRFARTFGAKGDQVTDNSDPITVSDTTLTEVATVQVAPFSDVNVTLDAHATVAIDTGADGNVNLVIARDSCAGEVVGSGTWVTPDVSAAQTATISVTGSDQVSTDTTYALCAAASPLAAQRA